MSSDSPIIGPIAAVYAGDLGAGTVLTKVESERTKGSRIKHGMPEGYSPVQDNSIQIGFNAINFRLTFYGGPDAFEDQIMRFAMGNSFESGGVAVDDPSSYARYVLLLLSNDPDTKSSYLIPQCYSLKNYEDNREKSAPEEHPIDFVGTNRNRFVKLFRKGTYASLATLLGGRTPI